MIKSVHMTRLGDIVALTLVTLLLLNLVVLIIYTLIKRIWLRNNYISTSIQSDDRNAIIPAAIVIDRV